MAFSSISEVSRHYLYFRNSGQERGFAGVGYGFFLVRVLPLYSFCIRPRLYSSSGPWAMAMERSSFQASRTRTCQIL